ncbi:uncharacterized protein LOC118362042 [Oncorhynchus keta]|uniref:uncharacterized protein LOC118362042 n=1 Tax=Oncorhynchus keta TaxID=8018 RepID=UPI0015FDE95D|nr:uncharacterized protein LOC118362042 [Oncorhynchus keta]
MGSTGSRSRLSQVAPCHSQTEGDLDQQASHPTSQWTIPAIPTPLEQQHQPLGHRRTTQLPPLKLENPATFPPLSTASHKVTSFSIIHPQPPRRLQGRDRRDGGVLHFSTPSQGAHGGTGCQPQGGLLEAQMVLSQQAQQRQRAQQRQVREQREHERIFYTDNFGAPSIQTLHLLNRPTLGDIFWDWMTGESLALREILQQRPLPPEQGERQQYQPGPQPLRLCRDEELINRDLAWGGLRSPHQKTNTLTDRGRGDGWWTDFEENLTLDAGLEDRETRRSSSQTLELFRG